MTTIAVIGLILTIVWFFIQRAYKYKDEKPQRDLQAERQELERQNQEAMKNGDIQEMQRTRAELDKLQREVI